MSVMRWWLLRRLPKRLRGSWPPGWTLEPWPSFEQYRMSWAERLLLWRPFRERYPAPHDMRRIDHSVEDDDGDPG